MKINSNFKSVAIQAAKEAGGILERHFRKPIKNSLKKDLSLVTNVDLKAEKAIIKSIKKNFPSHDILSEEKGGKIGEKYTWVIDPLDGTTNYTKKFPFFATSITLLYERNPIFSVVFNPLSKEIYFAEKGKGSFLNGKRIRIGQQQTLSKAVILFNKGRAKEDLIKFHKILGKVGKLCRTFRFWGALGLELCYVAAGRIDGHIDVGSKCWDFAAGVLIIKEAGGKVTNFRGKDWQIDTKNVIATNGKIHNQLLKLVK